jgi:alkanesulfonate monooxygenase SsuD/methylene tetrahydromethanopterin reductase-like flavin-dependent oxidoreductase (luciferase family)
MKFSLFFEMQIADPTRQSERQLFHDCVAQAKVADELGYHCVWAVEHHGLYEYAHSSAPEIFLSFVAAQTTRIRIGHGCTLLPHRYNHPIRIAERLATLDILSNGRLNWGSAKSASRVELEAFQIERSDTESQWLEALEIIPRIWSSEVFSHSGRHFNIPPTRVVPKPVQQPHPPMFAACSDPQRAPGIGRLGLGALNLATYHDELLGQHVAAYREAADNAIPIGGGAVTNHFACTPATLVLKDDHRACCAGLRGANFFMQAMLHYYGQSRPIGPVNASRGTPSSEEIATFKRRRNTPRSQLSSVIGDPESARESIQRFVDVGVDEVILVMQTGTTPHELVMESIQTFGEDVLPYFV